MINKLADCDFVIYISDLMSAVRICLIVSLRMDHHSFLGNRARAHVDKFDWVGFHNGKLLL